MKSFDFKGPVSSSKSYFNRALILSYYKKSLKIMGQSKSLDIDYLQKAIQNFGSDLEVGEGGTTLRFLSFLVSRQLGSWRLKGSHRLFSRPQNELKNILNQLGVQVYFEADSLKIVSEGWVYSEVVSLDLSKSSQFASGLILNSWDLPFDLNIQLSQERVSDGYLEMTLDLVSKSGMRFVRNENLIQIPAQQKIKIDQIYIEPDLSSAFVIASLAAARGRCEIDQFPFESLQPDLYFVELFKKMQIPIEQRGPTLFVQRGSDLKPLEVSLKQAPDLFPVLCVLLTKVKGKSRIFDTPQLLYKESNRLQKTSELLTLMKVEHQLERNGITILSTGRHHHEFFEFDPDQDHRLAFAGALAKAMGYRMRIKNSHVVDKSFSDFWSLIGGGPG